MDGQSVPRSCPRAVGTHALKDVCALTAVVEWIHPRRFTCHLQSPASYAELQMCLENDDCRFHDNSPRTWPWPPRSRLTISEALPRVYGDKEAVWRCRARPPRRQVARLPGASDPALGEGTLLIQEEAERGASRRESAPHEVSPSRQQR